MKTNRVSQQGNIRPAVEAGEVSESVDETFDPLSTEWRGALEYDRDHGSEVLCAKKECVAQGHSLNGAE